MGPPLRRGAAGRRGFTLAESLIASVVLAIAVVSIAGTLTATYQSMSSSSETSEAVAMAQQLIEEIAAKPFAVPSGEVDNPGFPSGITDRSTYDSIDDYHGFTDTSADITKLDGASVTAGSGGVFTRSVTITPGVLPTGHTAPAADFAMVAVTVTKPSGEAITISRLAARSVVVP
jgi:prepilin-type N-terminal cleavage/methylation domain-containing protein